MNGSGGVQLLAGSGVITTSPSSLRVLSHYTLLYQVDLVLELLELVPCGILRNHRAHQSIGPHVLFVDCLLFTHLLVRPWFFLHEGMLRLASKPGSWVHAV